MFRRRSFFIGVIAIGAAAVGWWLFSPLLFNKTVEEAFPFELPSESEMAEMSDAEMKDLEAEFEAAMPDAEALSELSAEEEAELQEMVEEAAAAVMSDTDVAEDMPAAELVLIASGEFVGQDAFHEGSGQVAVYQQGDEFVVRFENFRVTNGPDLHVILVKHPSPSNSDEVGSDYIDLGSLKGNQGNQNYPVPEGIDASEFQSVVIYCVPFHVVFSVGSLN